MQITKPKKAKRPCRFKSCPALTDSSSGYYKQHEKLISSNYNRFGRSADAKKRYGYRWRKIRAAFQDSTTRGGAGIGAGKKSKSLDEKILEGKFKPA